MLPDEVRASGPLILQQLVLDDFNSCRFAFIRG